MTNELFKDNLVFQYGALDKFRLRFQRSLRRCVKRGFSDEECFGVIWEETLEEIALCEADQSLLYQELIHWVKVAALRQPRLIQTQEFARHKRSQVSHPSFR